MSDDSILRQVVDLQRLDLSGLRDRWKELFATEPPSYGRDLLRRRLAYRIQERAYGGLPEATRQRLREIDAQARATSAAKKVADGIPITGSVIVREYEGIRHEVTVLAEGFEYRGKRWRSLSEIARAITGTRWNGPLFFGLRSKRKKP